MNRIKNMEKFALIFMVAWGFTFIFTGVFHKIEVSCPNNSICRKIFDCLSSMMAFILLMSPFIFGVIAYIFNFITLATSIIIIIVYMIGLTIISKSFTK